MGQRKRIDLHCMYLPDDIGTIDWGRYEHKPNSKRKNKTTKGRRRVERDVSDGTPRGGIGSGGVDRNTDAAGAKLGERRPLATVMRSGAEQVGIR